MRTMLRTLLATAGLTLVALLALGGTAAPAGARPAARGQEIGEYTNGLKPASDFAGDATSTQPNNDKITDKLEEHGIKPVYLIAVGGIAALVLLVKTTKSTR